MPCLHGVLYNRYASTDIVALVLVPKLPTTSVVHHVISGAFMLYLWTVDLTNPTSVGTAMAQLIDMYV